MNRRIRGIRRVRIQGVQALLAVGAVFSGIVAVIVGGIVSAGAILPSVAPVWVGVTFTFGILAAILASLSYISGHIYGMNGGPPTGTGTFCPPQPGTGGGPSTCTGGATGTTGGATGTRFSGTCTYGGGTCPFACECESGTCGRGGGGCYPGTCVRPGGGGGC